ncbi:hemolysin activation/secretion protein [Herbaspirillum sp. YR522]|nr:hemolysin activation/secretion protein [Herbaspirillum sp. YR522]
MGMALATAALGAFAQSPATTGQEPMAEAVDRFEIRRFEIQGNTLLKPAELERAVNPYTGTGRVYGDVQKALEALEAAYRGAGYSAVQVFVPEQELSAGVVRIEVVETVIGRVTVADNKHFSAANIRASIPGLQEGRTPNLRRISESVQLANDNPAKQVNVNLATADDGGIDATVNVTDYNPLRVMLTVDNSGTADTGHFRTGVALQHSNLFDRDHVGTVAYTTSPDSPAGSKVDLYSLGYRVPLYGIGDSIDFIYGKSNVTSGQSPTLGGVLAITGKGNVYAMRWNHFFARQGERTSKLVFGADYKKVDSTCSLLGISAGIESCAPYSTLPLSLTYSAQQQSIGQVLDYNLGIARNIATGAARTGSTGLTDRYSVFASGRRAADHFVIVRGGASLFKGFANDWQLRLASTVQVSPHALVPVEQVGLVGASAVRGFTERAVAADSGVIVNSEIYTPDLLAKSEVKGSLRLLGFIDAGRGFNNNTGGSTLASTVSVASIGLGARYALGRDFNLRLDVARVQLNGGASTEKRGDLNAHLSAVLGF